MKILILGASGFVGRNLKEYFENKYDLHTPSSSELNMLDDDAVAKYIKSHSFDLVLNALDRRTVIKTPADSAVYVTERLRMFENISSLNDYYGCMLYFGSGAEYCKSRPLKFIKEDQFGRVVPKDPYGFLMYTMQKLAFSKKNITNFRLFGIFGPYEAYKRRFISNAICKVLCGYPITIRQNAIFDYLHTDDLCKMTEFYIKTPMQQQAYNATSGKRYELNALAQIIINIIGNEVPILIANPGFKDEYSASNELYLQEDKRFTVECIQAQIKHLVDYYKAMKNQIDREALLYNS